jgi:predicted transcriptional regulator YdeE
MIQIIEIPTMIVIGKELRTTFKNNQCYSEIPKFWEEQRKSNLFEFIPNKIYKDVILGLYTNYSPDFSLNSGYYSLIIGCPVSRIEKIPDGMVAKEITAAKYAIFIAKGPFAESIDNAWAKIWQNKEIQRKFINDFEWYDSKSTNDKNSEVKIYVSIK